MKNILALLTATFTAFFASGAGATETDLRAYYDDGFFLEDAQSRFQLRLAGNIHFDARAYQSEERGAPHSFDIRRARIDFQGRIYQWLTFRLQTELSGSPYVRNAWVDGSPGSWFHLRVGQMKVPFSSSWLTRDNNVNFIERGTSTPVYPFFDRGLVLWGSFGDDLLTYNLGAFTGAGLDADTGQGDIDDSKDLVARLFLQPFRHTSTPAIEGIYLAGGVTWGRMSVPTTRFETGGVTWGRMSVPTTRFETGGLASANYETAIWRWRTEQLIGTDGRVTDAVGAGIDTRLRLGGELHYLFEFFTLSAEYAEARYYGIELHHDLTQGSSRVARETLLRRSGSVRNLSAWISFYVTGERKQLSNWGWKAPKPRASLGEGGPGAFEILARYSRTWTDEKLFDAISVDGFEPGDPALPIDYGGTTPGDGNGLGLAILDGAHDVHEFTLGISWFLNPMVRIQLNDVFLWAPDDDRDGDGQSDNLLVSGAKSAQADPALKNLKTGWENAVMARLVFKI